MSNAQRGAALPETMLTIGFTLMLLFAVVRLSIFSFYQLMADGAAFTAAHLAGANGSTSNVAQATSGVFPKVLASDINLSLAGTTAQAIVTKSVAGLVLVPGASTSMTVVGQALEPQAPIAANVGLPYTFAVTATLINYCPPPGNAQGVNCTVPHTVYLAQFIDPAGRGNGAVGAFAEWFCHAGVLGGLSFPSNRPTPGPNWDPSKSQGQQYAIYQWDAGNAC